MTLDEKAFPIGYVFPNTLNEIRIYYTTFAFVIFLPSAYFPIAFAVGGIVKTFVKKAKKKEGNT